ncbi:major facilitator superfamily transporter [Exophiala viscosa]|uniref:major facilitator superfamily transporter n=1 Tax=Exophiala viscosa TaxID=2486360 RepID=UPI00219FF5C1|nr:major facilitator superfamily transporter [Exophiala viscosa]
MEESTIDHRDPSFWAPGTLTLEDLQAANTKVLLHPVPTSDPNDPLNWASWRKALNYGLVCFYVLMTFVELDIGFTAWEDYEIELGFSVDLLNGAAATNYAGLAIGCIFFVPLVNKYGRRPMYLFSTALQLASVIWFAKTETRGDLIGSNLISGLGGAISETIVQMTIADLFFVHNHAAMNAYYMLATSIGAFLGPVASGYVVVSQGWRWMFWWCTIFFAINLVALIFLFEETKYVSVLVGHNGAKQRPVQENPRGGSIEQPNPGDSKPAELGSAVEPTRLESHLHIDPTIRMKTFWERLPLITKTDGSILHDIYQPIVVLFTFPAIAYTAMTYGSLLAWFATMTSVQATYLFYPPYNFSAAGVGLMNVAPFVGVIPGTFVGGYLNDKSILWLSKRNSGIYEPEMRLWLALVGALITPAGILMFGVGLAHSAAWPVLAVGYGLFGFGFSMVGDIALSYAMDCYQNIIGNALVGVVFTRNIFSVIILFALTPWINGMGVQNVHVLIAVLCFALSMLPVPLLIWGKKARIATATRYRKMASQQPTHRDI